jgi:hypothetical protein
MDLMPPARVRALGPVLRDPEADRELADLAATRLRTPLISPTETAPLRDAFGEIYGWNGGGWYNAFNDPDPVARQRAELVSPSSSTLPSPSSSWASSRSWPHSW